MPGLPEMFDLHGRVAIVTGGAGLLGAEFCRTLAQAGARVVVADLDGGAAEAISSALNEAQPADAPVAVAVETDVTQAQSVQGLVAEALERFGRLDILVNSAARDPKFTPGQTEKAPDELANAFEDFPLVAWREALDVNLTGVFLASQAAVQPMLSQGGGVIVNLCSIYGLVGPDQRLYQRAGEDIQYKPVYYSVTKAGLLGLTRYLATYYAGKNIRVNALTPGGVFDQHDDAFLQAYAARTLLGRMAEKDELNGALLFLTSDASSYMTGANLVVDGGWTAW